VMPSIPCPAPVTSAASRAAQMARCKPSAAVLDAPSFRAASFLYDGRNVDLTISLNY
jgi:hypothetical protein